MRRMKLSPGAAVHSKMQDQFPRMAGTSPAATAILEREAQRPQSSLRYWMNPERSATAS
jgi:hypothetical protein